MDVHSKKVRSYNMSCIRSKHTKPEELVCKYLFSLGFRYRKNDKRYPGTPDIVLPKYKTMVFINGCFWHGHDGCRYYVVPKTNTDFWVNKINRNIERDKENTERLIHLGWNIITIWECQLKFSEVEQTLEILTEKIRSN